MWAHSSTPAMVLNNSPARCCGVPLPADAKLSTGLPAFARARNSARVLTPSEGCISSTSGKADRLDPRRRDRSAGRTACWRRARGSPPSGHWPPAVACAAAGACLATLALPVLPNSRRPCCPPPQARPGGFAPGLRCMCAIRSVGAAGRVGHHKADGLAGERGSGRLCGGLPCKAQGEDGQGCVEHCTAGGAGR